MMLDIILPWFPIVLSAAVGARLVGRSRSAWLGLTCGVYFVVVVQMATGIPFWSDAGMASALLAGFASIAAMAEWSGRRGDIMDRTAGEEVHHVSAGASLCDMRAVSGAISQFDEWLEEHRSSVDAWASFEEFVRHVLHEHCQATHVRPYRILAEGERMAPLRTLEASECEALTSARRGIPGHVATTGRSYYAHDSAQGKLVVSLADRSAEAPEWCFAVREGRRTIGLVSVAHLGNPAARDALQPWEGLIRLFWMTLTEVCRGRAAAQTDAVSQLMIRDSFLDEAARCASESYARGEPVSLCVLTVEGLRAVLDEGRWDVASEIVSEISATFRGRVRPDDLLGRFDEGRFLMLLRRVDSELASLIAGQLMDRLAALPALEATSGRGIRFRCGVAGSGTESVSVRDLLASALELCQAARRDSVELKSDVSGVEVLQAAGAARAESTA